MQSPRQPNTTQVSNGTVGARRSAKVWSTANDIVFRGCRLCKGARKKKSHKIIQSVFCCGPDSASEVADPVRRKPVPLTGLGPEEWRKLMANDTLPTAQHNLISSRKERDQWGCERVKKGEINLTPLATENRKIGNSGNVS